MKSINGNRNWDLDFLIPPSFQKINKLFVLSLEKEVQSTRTSYQRFYFPTREIKNYNVLIDGQNIF